MVSEQTKQRLQKAVEDTNRDLDWALQQYEESRDFVEEQALETLTESEIQDIAASRVEAEINESSRTMRGDEMELEILSIGHHEVKEGWGQDNDTVCYGYGFVYGPLGENGQGKAARAVFLNQQGKGMDMVEVQQKFRPLNTMQATYSVEPADNLDNVYQCWSTTGTQLNETETEHIPSDRESKLEVLRRSVPETSLAEFTENLTKFDPTSDGNYPYAFGADLRRIEARIVSRYVADDHSWGCYTIIDDSVTKDDIAGTKMVAENQNVPGLTALGQPDYHLSEHGKKTRADFYGIARTKQKNGQPVMDIVGVVPIIPMPVEDEQSGGSNVETTETKL